MNLDDRVKKMTAYLLAFRQLQDQSDTAFLASLGGLNLPQLNVLNAIGDSEPCTMGDIAKRVVLSLSSVTLIVDKLLKLKLALRVRSKTDRRIVYARLTPEGQKIYQVQIEHMHLVSTKMLSVLTAEEQGMLLQILDKLTAQPQIA
jgi:MarR family 2-MHQ and catechol resistance regulon transcriptional repressor